MKIFLQTIAGLAMACLSGALLTLAFPPFDLWPLSLIGFVPAIVAKHRVLPARISGLAYGVGLGGFYWGYFGPIFSDNVWFMHWLPVLVGIVATLASNGDRAFQTQTGYKWFVLEGAVVWVGIEALRGLAPFIGTGGLVAFSFYSQPWLIQPVGVFGIFGLGLLIMLANYSIALAALALIDRSGASADRIVGVKLAISWLGAIAVLFICWIGLSLGQLGQAEVSGSSLRVAAIQPGSTAGQEERTSRLIQLTREAASGGARLIVWPEGALNFDPQLHISTVFGPLAQETNVYLAIGYGFRTSEGLRNEYTMLSPDGQLLGVYGKDHPVVWMGETSLTHGTYPTYQTPFGVLGTIICYDLNFTDTARKVAGNGAQIIAVGSNDWPSLGRSQYTNLVMRAIENRVSLVKADTSYDSAVIDPSGRIVALAVSSTPQSMILMADVPLGKANAPLIFLGDWLGWVCIAGSVAFIIFDIIVRRGSKKRVPQPRSLQYAENAAQP